MSDEKPSKLTLHQQLEKQPGILRLDFPEHSFVGREQQADALIESIYKKRMKNVILIGQAGVGKSELVKHVAELLKSKCVVYSLAMGSSIAGTSYRGDFEQKLMDVINLCRDINMNPMLKKAILFIDEIHTIYGTGSTGESKMDASNILKPYLSEGKIIIWGATTPDEYASTIVKDPALRRRFSEIWVPELQPYQAVEAVTSFGGDDLKQYCVGPVEDTVTEIIKLSTEIEGSYPDKCIEIADRAMARCIRCKCKISNELLREIVEQMKQGAITREKTLQKLSRP